LGNDISVLPVTTCATWYTCQSPNNNIKPTTQTRNNSQTTRKNGTYEQGLSFPTWKWLARDPDPKHRRTATQGATQGAGKK